MSGATALRVTWRDIAEQLRSAIERGDYGERQKLPSALALAEASGLDVASGARALRSLVADGLATAVPGRGTYAAPRPAAGLTEDEREWCVAGADGSLVRVGVDPDGNVRVAGTARLTTGQADQLIDALRRAAARARQITVPPALARALAPTRSGGHPAVVVAAELARVIRAGAYPPGAALPAAADLNSACRGSLNDATVSKALAMLAGQGLAEQAADGWRVCAALPQETAPAP